MLNSLYIKFSGRGKIVVPNLKWWLVLRNWFERKNPQLMEWGCGFNAQGDWF